MGHGFTLPIGVLFSALTLELSQALTDSPEGPLWKVIELGGTVAVVGGFLWYLTKRDRSVELLTSRVIRALEDNSQALHGLTASITELRAEHVQMAKHACKYVDSHG